MKKAKSLQDLAAELTRQRDAKQDYLADTRKIGVELQNEKWPVVILDGVYPDWQQTNLRPHPIRPIAHRQLGDFSGIQAKYYDKMLKDAPELLVANLNHWLDKTPDTRMVRTLDGNMRAFLSKTYRTLDNFDCFEAVYPVLERNNLRIESCEITERKLYIKAVVTDRKVEVKAESTEWGKGHNQIHVIQPGIVISNSETGFSSVSIKPAIHDTHCSNLAVFTKDAARKIHVQGALKIDDAVMQYIKDDTRRAADIAFWKTIQDLTEACLEGSLFDKYVDGVRESMGLKVEGNPAKMIEVLAKDLSLTEHEKDGIIERLIKSGEPTKYGVQAAITSMSQATEDYDRASELEEIGGRVIELSPTQWTKANELALAA
jgi:hypothetical protein